MVSKYSYIIFFSKSYIWFHWFQKRSNILTISVLSINKNLKHQPEDNDKGIFGHVCKSLFTSFVYVSPLPLW